MLTPLRGDRVALKFGEKSLTYQELGHVAANLARQLAGHERVALVAKPSLETCAAVVAALLAGVAVIPVNPSVGTREREHILSDSAPDLVLADIQLDDTPTSVPSNDIDPETPAFVIYTSGTTGPPKGVVLPRRAVMANIDAVAKAWEWTSEDVLVHALPLFHVHGLILGVVGPLRVGGSLHHIGKFSPAAVAAELAGEATMMFGVPTMYHRLAQEAEKDPVLAESVGNARLLVSGSAALPATVHSRIFRATGQRIVERYGMTETLMICGVRASGERRPGTVGPPLDGVELRIVDGEIEVRGPSLFQGYLNRPDPLHDGWFRTGDMATVDPDGYVRIIGRKATDLIKSGGYKIGAGEIENALLEHPGVAEAAVTGEPDDDLGERVVAWIVPTPGARPGAQELADHVAKLLTPHKRPRVVRFLDALPRNEMGKVRKQALQAPAS